VAGLFFRHSSTKFGFRSQINVPHHAGVVHSSTPLALCDFLPQIRQSNVGSVAPHLESAFDIGPSVRISGKTSALSRTGNREAVGSGWIMELGVSKGGGASVINGDPSRRHRSRGARVVGSHGVNQAPPLGVPALGTF